MTIAGFALVFVAALCHASWNFFIKRIGGGLELIWLFSILSAVIYLPLALYALWTMQSGLTSEQWMVLAGSTVLHLAYFALLQRGYRFGDLSLVYPVARATGPLLTALVAVLWFHNPVSLQSVVGIALIVFGVLMLSGLFSRSAGPAPAVIIRSVAFGLSVGILIASYTLWDARAVGILGISPLLLDYMPSLVRTVILSPVAMRRRVAVATAWREHRYRVLGVAVLAPLAYILVLYAMRFTPVIYVAPARELSVLFTVLLGTLVLNEGHLRRRLVWAAVTVAGVGLLATG